MATKEKVKKMSEEDEQKMAMWIRESKGRSSLLPDEKMAERYPVAYSMLCDEQQEQSAKEQPKEDETIDITDSSVVTPSVTGGTDTGRTSHETDKQQAAQALLGGIPLCLSPCPQDREPYARVHQCQTP